MTDTIAREELVQALAGHEVVILEALPPMYFEKEHLPGARNLPLDDVDAIASVLVPDRATPIVTYCSNLECNNSAIAAERLRALGYTNVRTYRGGKQEWIEAGLSVETGAAAAAADR